MSGVDASATAAPRSGPPGLAQLPPPQSALAAVARLADAVDRKVVVLDDDPTGTQTVYGFDVLTEWTEPALASALADPRRCFFVLTNSRSLPESEAVALTTRLASNLAAAARATGQAYTVISRSDSTLRGHFPAEIDALAAVEAAPYDGVIVAPAFIEAGRLTVDGVHYVREGSRWLPAGETEFARDATFGYHSSALRDWIEEKTGGRVGAKSVVSIPLAVLRGPDGAHAVRERLLAMPRGAFVAVDAADYGDLEVFVHGLLLAESTGRRYLCRTAASFVRVRAALPPKPLLGPAEFRTGQGSGGLVVVGSYTARTTAQLEAALAARGALAVEFDVGRLAAPGGAEAELGRVLPTIDVALRDGATVCVYTSRARDTALGRAGDLGVGRVVSEALVALVRRVGVLPRFLVAKGGITSSDIAVRALGIRRALVLGQVEPGVPVWRAGPESRWPGLTYVVFPGNVGDADTLGSVLEKFGA